VTRRRHRAVAVTAAVVVSPLFGAGLAAAAPALVDVDAAVDVSDEGTAQVELDYLIAGGADGEDPASTLSFSALAFDGSGDVPIENVEVTTADGDRLDTSVETVDLKTTVTVTLSEPLASGGEQELTVRYDAPGAGSVDGDTMTADVPVLAFDLPAATTAPGIFTASVLLAPGYDYVEGFPANPESVGSSGDRAEVAYDVPAMPSLLRSVATTGDGPFLTLGGTVNAVLFVVLLVGGVGLYLSFTRGQKRAAEVAAATPERGH
jgi:hypothetical protein